MGTVTLDEVQRLIAEACAPLKADQASLKARIFDLENEVAENAAMYNQDVLVFAPQHICNVAAMYTLNIKQCKSNISKPTSQHQKL